MSTPPKPDPRIAMHAIQAIRDALRRQFVRINNHPRVRNLTIWGAVGTVLLYAVRQVFNSEIERMARATWRVISALPAQPVGFVLAAVAVWIVVLFGVLLVWVAVDVRRQALAAVNADVRAERESARLQLEAMRAEKDRAIAERAQQSIAMTCGSVRGSVRGSVPWSVQPLSEADLAVLTAKMQVLRPFLLEAQASSKNLMYKVMRAMWDLGDSDPRFYLEAFLSDYVAGRAQHSLGELNEAVDDSRDSREFLALFLNAYGENVVWMGRICGLFINRPLDDFEGFPEWRERDAQMIAALKAHLVAPQLGEVRRWIEGNKREPTADIVARVTRPAMGP